MSVNTANKAFPALNIFGLVFLSMMVSGCQAFFGSDYRESNISTGTDTEDTENLDDTEATFGQHGLSIWNGNEISEAFYQKAPVADIPNYFANNGGGLATDKNAETSSETHQLTIFNAAFKYCVEAVGRSTNDTQNRAVFFEGTIFTGDFDNSFDPNLVLASIEQREEIAEFFVKKFEGPVVVVTATRQSLVDEITNLISDMYNNLEGSDLTNQQETRRILIGACTASMAASFTHR